MSTDKEMNTYDFFLSTTKQKAHENEKAFNLLYENKMYVTCVYLLRIQLDCYVRLLYLKEQTEEKRTVLLENFYQGSRWKISDRNMLETVSRYGWEKNVYTLSCSFIHLSRLSNINDENDENI